MNTVALLMVYWVPMKGLFNKTFYRFTAGFISILIAAFTLVALVRHFETV